MVTSFGTKKESALGVFRESALGVKGGEVGDLVVTGEFTLPTLGICRYDEDGKDFIDVVEGNEASGSPYADSETKFSPQSGATGKKLLVLTYSDGVTDPETSTAQANTEEFCIYRPDDDEFDGFDATPVTPVPAGRIRNIVEIGGQAYVCGTFSGLGGNSAINLARWDGDTFHQVGNFPTGADYNDQAVKDIIKFNNVFYCATGTARTAAPSNILDTAFRVLVGNESDGTWATAGPETLRHNGPGVGDTGASSLIAFGGEIWIGSDSEDLIGVDSSTVFRRILRFNPNNNTFTEVDDGLDDNVCGLIVFKGELYVFGFFLNDGPGSTIKGPLVKWNPSAETLDDVGGITKTAGVGAIRCAVVHRDRLWIGGSFDTIDGDVFFSNIAYMDTDGDWHDPVVGRGGPGLNDEVYGLGFIK